MGSSRTLCLGVGGRCCGMVYVAPVAPSTKTTEGSCPPRIAALRLMKDESESELYRSARRQPASAPSGYNRPRRRPVRILLNTPLAVCVLSTWQEDSPCFGVQQFGLDECIDTYHTDLALHSAKPIQPSFKQPYISWRRLLVASTVAHCRRSATAYRHSHCWRTGAPEFIIIHHSTLMLWYLLWLGIQIQLATDAPSE